MQNVHIRNNEGSDITVSGETYNQMQEALTSGTWAVLVRDINGKTHSVLLQSMNS